MSDVQKVIPLTRGMRGLLIVAGVLVALAGLQLFVFSERTDRYFAWTVDPPLTAAFLGASYWASAFLQFGAARQRLWANARIAIPPVFVFTVLTLTVTLIHLDRFHLGTEFEAGTRVVTWLWIVVYSVVPVVMGVIWARQNRVRGDYPPPSRPLPGWLRTVVGLQGLVFAAVGLALLIAPVQTAAIWPWELTALTGRAIGAWVIGLATAAGYALYEDSLDRLRPAAYSFLAFGLLQGWALARYPDDFDWSGPSGVIYVLVLASVMAVGLGGLLLAKTSGRSEVQPANRRPA